jgi:hypothetical protein
VYLSKRLTLRKEGISDRKQDYTKLSAVRRRSAETPNARPGGGRRDTGTSGCIYHTSSLIRRPGSNETLFLDLLIHTVALAR